MSDSANLIGIVWNQIAQLKERGFTPGVLKCGHEAHAGLLCALGIPEGGNLGTLLGLRVESDRSLPSKVLRVTQGLEDPFSHNDLTPSDPELTRKSEVFCTARSSLRPI